MKRIKTEILGLLLIVLAPNQALAGNSGQGSSNTLLVGIFIGFCVLLVAVQLLPTLLLVVGTVKGFFGKSAGRNLGQNI